MIPSFNPVLGKLRWPFAAVILGCLLYGTVLVVTTKAAAPSAVVAQSPSERPPPISTSAMAARTGQVAHRSCKRHAKHWSEEYPNSAFTCNSYGAEYCKQSRVDNSRGHCQGWFDAYSQTYMGGFFCTATVRWAIVAEPIIFGGYVWVIKRTNNPRWHCDYAPPGVDPEPASV